ncbi:MAG: crossover junction endodeoxyribonuclease RuvC [Candidatus Longimicrobiales bacterium M2_2A_002]
MTILALDLSLTCTGWATADACGTLSPPKGADRGTARLAWIRDAVLERVEAAELVVLEGYAYARGNRAHQIGELGGVIRLALHDRGVPYVEIPPSTLKKLATGKGNAGKERVLVEAVKRLRYAGSDNNEADALWLHQLALHALDLPGAVALPKLHLEAIDPDRWAHVAPPADSARNDANGPHQEELELVEVGP